MVISRHGKPVVRLIPEPSGQAGAELCRLVCFEPDDFAMVRHRQRYRPGIAALPLLLQLQLAYRLGLLPVPSIGIWLRRLARFPIRSKPLSPLKLLV